MCTGTEVSFTFDGEVCRRFQGVFCPVQQGFFFHGEGADVAAAGLEDGHADGFDVVDPVIGIQCPECVTHHLRIVFCFHQDAESVFEVDDVQDLVCNDQAVAGSEGIRNPSGEVQALFHKNLRIAAEFLCFLQLFHDIGAVLVRAVCHFLIIVREGFCGILGSLSQCSQDFVFA